MDGWGGKLDQIGIRLTQLSYKIEGTLLTWLYLKQYTNVNIVHSLKLLSPMAPHHPTELCFITFLFKFEEVD